MQLPNLTTFNSELDDIDSETNKVFLIGSVILVTTVLVGSYIVIKYKL